MKIKLKSQIALIEVCEHELSQFNEVDVFDYMDHIESVHGRKLWKNEGGDFVSTDALRLCQLDLDFIEEVLKRAKQMLKSELAQLSKSKEQLIGEQTNELVHKLAIWDFEAILKKCRNEDIDSLSDFFGILEPIALELQDYHNTCHNIECS